MTKEETVKKINEILDKLSDEDHEYVTRHIRTTSRKILTPDELCFFNWITRETKGKWTIKELSDTPGFLSEDKVKKLLSNLKKKGHDLVKMGYIKEEPSPSMGQG